MTQPIEDGLMLRDYFAGKAMQSLILASANNGHIAQMLETDAGLAKQAYELADIMIKERSK